MQIRFPSSEARTSFIAALRRDDRYLFDHVRALSSQPTVVVVTGLEGSASERLRALLASPVGRSAKVYGDVQFETFS